MYDGQKLLTGRKDLLPVGENNTLLLASAVTAILTAQLSVDQSRHRQTTSYIVTRLVQLEATLNSSALTLHHIV